MTDAIVDFKTHCRLPIGFYCMIHDEPHPSNTETPRAKSAIASNTASLLAIKRRSAYLLSLDTGKRVLRRNWTELPMDKQIVEAVDDTAFAGPGTQPSHRQPSI